MKNENKLVMFDPPSGWMYGFPKPIPLNIIGNDEALTQLLIDAGYPSRDIPLALRHSRYWDYKEDLDES